MTEGPISIPIPFLKYPLKRLFFITIKDNTQKSRWCSIGKINDWIRRYSTTYNIVRGTQGGTHFHILAGTRADARAFRFQKGIHFDVRCLAGNSRSGFTHEALGWMLEGQDLSAEIMSNNVDNYQCEITPHQQDLLKIICDSIRKLRKKKKDKETRETRKTAKEKTIQRLLDYLRKNVLEPREDEPYMFHDYMRTGC